MQVLSFNLLCCVLALEVIRAMAISSVQKKPGSRMAAEISPNTVGQHFFLEKLENDPAKLL